MGKHIAVLVALFFATGARAELGASLAAVSDYDFRGTSLSARNPALQGSLDYTFGDSGFSGGLWASTVDFGSDVDAQFELDYYLDYEYALNDALALYAGISVYTYPTSDDLDASAEAYVGFGNDDFYVLQWYTDDYSSLGQTAHYTEANYTASLSDAVALKLHAGYSYGEAFEDAEMLDYSVGVEYTAGNFVVGARFVATDASGDLEVRGDVFNNQPRVLVSISTTFPWTSD